VRLVLVSPPLLRSVEGARRAAAAEACRAERGGTWVDASRILPVAASLSPSTRTHSFRHYRINCSCMRSGVDTHAHARAHKAAEQARQIVTFPPPLRRLHPVQTPGRRVTGRHELRCFLLRLLTGEKRKRRKGQRTALLFPPARRNNTTQLLPACVCTRARVCARVCFLNSFF